VLVQEKLRPILTIEQAARLVDALARDSQIADDPAERQPVSRDPNDDYLIALARSVSADVLVTAFNLRRRRAAAGLRPGQQRRTLRPHGSGRLILPGERDDVVVLLFDIVRHAQEIQGSWRKTMAKKKLTKT
jgi:hypothetical protein